jgi:hypothetical protein
MGLLKTALGWSFVQKGLRGQVTTLAAAGAGWIITHVPGLPYDQQAIYGALACIGLVALQWGENQILGKVAADKATQKAWGQST